MSVRLVDSTIPDVGTPAHRHVDTSLRYAATLVYPQVCLGGQEFLGEIQWLSTALPCVSTAVYL
eukprot:786592-Rhodomonas_salina.1